MSEMTEVAVETTTVRPLTERDIESVVRIDALATGRRRPHYFELMLQRALKFAGLQVSLVAELRGEVVGYLIGSLYYGEYGAIEPAASIDALGVSPDFRRHHVGRDLMREFRDTVAAVGITSIRTEVDWDDFDVLAFFRNEGFTPSSRVCLEWSATA